VAVKNTANFAYNALFIYFMHIVGNSTIIVFVVLVVLVMLPLSLPPFLPGTSLEPTVIPTMEVSSFSLHYFPYYV
jgi:hypothetical protein